MKKYWILTNGPQISSVMTGEFLPGMLPSGYQIETNLDQSVILSGYGFYNNELVHVGQKPSVMHKLDLDSPQWILDNAQVEAYRREVKLRINAKREQLLREPVQFSSTYYDADERAITNLQMWRDRALPDGFVWMDAANEPHIIDTDFIDNLLYTIAVRGTQLYQISWAKKVEIDQLTAAELLSYDVDAGWQG